MAIPEQPFGFVAGRWVLSLADTPMDADRAPDYAPLYPGSVIFNNKLSHRVVAEGSGTVGIVKTRIEATLNEDGKLIDAEGHEFIALPVGVYSVTFSFGQDAWPNFDIEVKAEHTVDSPLWLPSKSPVPAGPGIVHVVKEEDRIRAEAAALLAEGFSDSAEASALAASLASSERGVRVDNSVGTRVFLDHPGGSTMIYGDTGWRNVSGLLINGWAGTVLYRRVNDDNILSVFGLDGTNATKTRFLSQIPLWESMGVWRGATFSASMVWSRLVAPGAYFVIPSATQYGDIRWNNTRAWPTTLPGTPY